MSGEYPDSASVVALAISGSGLFAGGDFTMAGGVSATNIAKWNGSSWSALGLGLGPDRVQALAVSGTNLYAGGRFTTAGGNPANFVAKWDGNSWSTLGSGMDGRVHPPDVTALAVSGSDLYAGGWFEIAGGMQVNLIAKWNGSTWRVLGSGMADGGFSEFGPSVSALAVSGGNLYAGGNFTTPSGVSANNIAKWNRSNWSALGSGMDAESVVSTLAVSGSDLYIGGHFTTLGDVSGNHIAKWNGSNWSALGLGMGGVDYPWVGALLVSVGDLYAGGQFATAGGVSATNIAKWDGNRWSAVGSGLGGADGVNPPGVQALAVSGSDLYVGGSFTTAGGAPATNIAKWNGSVWSALSSGINGGVYALAISDSDLYAGGWFTTAGDVSANYIAKWNGCSWSSLGPGMNGFVGALAVSGSDLYAEGNFTTAGGFSANYIAKWDGTNWSTLGSGLGGVDNRAVAALMVSGSDLYVAGSFKTAGGMSANHIAKWDGSSWSPLGSGMSGFDPYVAAVVLMGNNLYAGGKFVMAGGKVSPFVARAYLELPTPPTLSLLHTGGSMTLSWPSSFGEFVLQQNPSVTNAKGWSDSIYALTTNGAIRSATVPVTTTNQFFRLISN
jgi:hypothetical protein